MSESYSYPLGYDSCGLNQNSDCHKQSESFDTTTYTTSSDSRFERAAYYTSYLTEVTPNLSERSMSSNIDINNFDIINDNVFSSLNHCPASADPVAVHYLNQAFESHSPSHLFTDSVYSAAHRYPGLTYWDHSVVCECEHVQPPPDCMRGDRPSTPSVEDSEVTNDINGVEGSPNDKEEQPPIRALVFVYVICTMILLKVSRTGFWLIPKKLLMHLISFWNIVLLTFSRMIGWHCGQRLSPSIIAISMTCETPYEMLLTRWPIASESSMPSSNNRLSRSF